MLHELLGYFFAKLIVCLVTWLLDYLVVWFLCCMVIWLHG